MILLNGSPITWKSTKQTCVAKSSAEAEFIAASQASNDILWARQMLAELGRPQTRPTPLFIDNQAALGLIKSENSIHPKLRHIDIDYMSIRDREARSLIVCKKIESEFNLADALTKS